MPEVIAKAGLEEVVAGESSICYIDGERGVLSYRGHNIHSLAENAQFEETAHLLWFGRLPRKTELEDLKKALAGSRRLAPPVLAFLRGLPPTARPMDVLRTTASLLGLYDPEAQDMSEEANIRKAFRLTGQFAAIVAGFHRLRNGREPVEADPDLGHAGALLQMLTGERPGPAAERVMNVALVLHADHELNASTFAARVTAATLADMHSAVTSAVGALKGPLHGGANEAVMDLLLTFPDPDMAVAKVRQMLAEKKKVPGFGHRVYRTEDPRATHLRSMSESLGKEKNELKWFRISRAIEEFLNREKRLNANVDFYSASTYYLLGIPTDLFTPVFAVSRIAGWTAHILEQFKYNRLIRPRAEYVGTADGRPWVPIEQR